MKKSVFAKLIAAINYPKQWLSETPLRALEEAYQAAVAIKNIETENFAGQKICAESNNETKSVVAYFKTDLEKHLNTIKIRLAEFKASRAFMPSNNYQSIEVKGTLRDREISRSAYIVEPQETQTIVKKLRFIDDVLDRYESEISTKPSSNTIRDSPKSNVVKVEKNNIPSEKRAVASPNSDNNKDNDSLNPPSDPQSTKMSVVPRSLLSTFNRVVRELSADESEEVENFRQAQKRTKRSIRLILILIIFPILAQQFSKNIIFGPIIDKVAESKPALIWVNNDLQEDALIELEQFQRKLEFNSLIGLAPKISPEETEEKLKEKAVELSENFKIESANSIKNFFADLCSVATFVILLITQKEEFKYIKAFIDSIVYGLSDSAKAFIIILFTDVFVGFHSPHGWEVIMENVFKHLGIPENREFIFLFIATFPVILNVLFKYWIFRYLSKLSPSAVVTYKSMNELG